MKLLLCLFIFLVIYCYLIYPLLLAVVARLRPHKVDKKMQTPSVSVVISVWNEEDVIENKLKNFLVLDYPADRFEILIGSDGSTDKTNDIIRKFKDKRIRLIEKNDRKGKMAMLNHLVALSKSEIIVFTDARQIFDRSALRELVENFADPKVGCVSGELMFSKKKGGTAKGINLYWNYEKTLRNLESDIHSMLGATGAIYAIRRALYSEVPADIVLDDVYIPFKIIEKGYRTIFDKSARAYDEVADSPREEYKRKTRTLFGNYQIFKIFAGLFNPFRSPIAIQFFSHKFLRVMIPFLLIGIFCLNTALVNDPFYKILFILQIIFYVMSVMGALLRHQKYGILNFFSKLCYIPYVFCLLNFSALVGFIRYIFSKQTITWEKARVQS
ncbi:MAG: glycosyltransferase family 2 protein [Candidatus Omnitrophica bacterium]|nr:glycosyltransferase family 2 protein [Candidatus Omnitrophota bacterium]